MNKGFILIFYMKKTEKAPKFKEEENRTKQIREKNRYLAELERRVKEKKASQKELNEILKDVEGYFSGAEMPSLKLYSGDYAGEILESAFENYPEIFSRGRYERMAKRAFRKLIANTYSTLMNKLGEGQIRSNQLLEFIKYAEPYLINNKEEEKENTEKIEFSFKRTSE